MFKIFQDILSQDILSQIVAIFFRNKCLIKFTNGITITTLLEKAQSLY